MNPSFTLIVNSTKEDDGVQYWCDAKLELEMTPPAPLVTSQSITATVYCESKKKQTKKPIQNKQILFCPLFQS